MKLQELKYHSRLSLFINSRTVIQIIKNELKHKIYKNKLENYTLHEKL